MSVLTVVDEKTSTVLYFQLFFICNLYSILCYFYSVLLFCKMYTKRVVLRDGAICTQQRCPMKYTV